jgi:hypothetical protein
MVHIMGSHIVYIMGSHFYFKIQFKTLLVDIYFKIYCMWKLLSVKVKVKVIPQQAEVTQGVPDRLRPRIFLTFSTTKVVGRQPYPPAAFTSGEIPDNHFQRLSRPQGTWFRRGGGARKKSPVTPPEVDPGTSRLVAQCITTKTGSHFLD